MVLNMSGQKKLKTKQLKSELAKEFHFLKEVFSVLTIPIQMKGEHDVLDYEIVNEGQKNPQENDEKQLKKEKRARTIAELEEKLEKIKSQHNFNLKTKLAKKSLSSKLNKKIKKRERLNKPRVKPTVDAPLADKVQHKDSKPHITAAKPVFNNDGKLVFSKFDFSKMGQKDRQNKIEKDPKKLLENLKQQEEKMKHLEETENGDKVKGLKEKIAWKNILQKAEGQKVKDDPILLKKSIKKMEQKKKHSKNQWENRVKGVEQKKEERQKKRRENISKKKKEKKSKVVKAAVKRGRVVI